MTFSTTLTHTHARIQFIIYMRKAPRTSINVAFSFCVSLAQPFDKQCLWPLDAMFEPFKFSEINHYLKVRIRYLIWSETKHQHLMCSDEIFG